MTDKRKGGLRYGDLGAKLVEEIPQLEDAYEKMLESWAPERPGPHIIYGDLLTPHIVRLLESGDDPDAIKKAFNLLERLIADDDEYVQEVAVVTVLERLQGDQQWLRLMKRYVGPLARVEVKALVLAWQGKVLDW